MKMNQVLLNQKQSFAANVSRSKRFSDSNSKVESNESEQPKTPKEKNKKKKLRLFLAALSAIAIAGILANKNKKSGLGNNISGRDFSQNFPKSTDGTKGKLANDNGTTDLTEAVIPEEKKSPTELNTKPNISENSNQQKGAAVSGDEGVITLVDDDSEGCKNTEDDVIILGDDYVCDTKDCEATTDQGENIESSEIHNRISYEHAIWQKIHDYIENSSLEFIPTGRQKGIVYRSNEVHLHDDIYYFEEITDEGEVIPYKVTYAEVEKYKYQLLTNVLAENIETTRINKLDEYKIQLGEILNNGIGRNKITEDEYKKAREIFSLIIKFMQQIDKDENTSEQSKQKLHEKFDELSKIMDSIENIYLELDQLEAEINASLGKPQVQNTDTIIVEPEDDISADEEDYEDGWEEEEEEEYDWA